MRGAPAIVVCILLAGCASPAPSASPDPDGSIDGGPVEIVAPTFREPIRLGAVDNAGAEPSVLVTARGTILVVAQPHLWRSLDGGASFEEIDASVLDDGGSDADLASDATGAIYYFGLDQGTSTPLRVSHDDGATWSAAFDVADGRDTDRQWIDALPNGSLRLTWRDQDDGTDLLAFRSSPDGGATWSPTRFVAPDTLQGPVTHDPVTSAAYFAYYEGGLRVARTADEGATFTHHDVTRESRDLTLRGGRPLDMFPVVAVDAQGALYLVWSADPEATPLGAKEVTVSSVWLSVSTDEGATWSAPRAISPEGRTSIFPWIVAGDAGRIAVAWYEARAGGTGHLAPDVWDVALVESFDGGKTFVGGHANTEPVHVGAICRSGGGCDRLCSDVTRGCIPTRICDVDPCIGYDRSRLEFFEMALMPDGHPILAWVADARSPAVGIEIHVGGVGSGTPLR